MTEKKQVVCSACIAWPTALPADIFHDAGCSKEPSAEPVDLEAADRWASQRAKGPMFDPPRRVNPEDEILARAYLALRAEVERLEARVSELEKYLTHQCGVPGDAAILAPREKGEKS